MTYITNIAKIKIIMITRKTKEITQNIIQIQKMKTHITGKTNRAQVNII